MLLFIVFLLIIKVFIFAFIYYIINYYFYIKKRKIETQNIFLNNVEIFNKIYYKLKYLPEEFFFTLCGEKIVKLEKKIIQKCKKDRNYKFLKKIHNTHIFLNNDVVLDAINPQYPYLYPIQLNLWYKKINEQ